MFRATLAVVFLFAGLATAQDGNMPRLLATEPPQPAAADSDLMKLKKERHATAWKELNEVSRLIHHGNYKLEDLESILGVCQRYLDSYMALEPTAADCVKTLEAYVEFAKEFDAKMQERAQARTIRPHTADRVRYFRQDAEVKLAEAKERK